MRLCINCIRNGRNCNLRFSEILGCWVSSGLEVVSEVSGVRVLEEGGEEAPSPRHHGLPHRASPVGGLEAGLSALSAMDTRVEDRGITWHSRYRAISITSVYQVYSAFIIIIRRPLTKYTEQS